MGSRSSTLWLAAGVAVAGVLAWLVSGDAPVPVERGSSAPGFELPRVDGGAPVSLASLHGRVVLLNFWATWCKPCEDELPAMERLHRSLAGSDFSLVGISVDADAAPVLAFRERIGLGFTLLLDSDQRVARSYQTFRFPETLLIGRDGVILERYVGPKEWDSPAYVDRIRRLLAAAPDTGG
jgi:peroxiredoxin